MGNDDEWNHEPVISPETVGEAHPMLPDGFRRTMWGIKNRGGPWKCHVCGGPSYLSYRCSKCGGDLADR